MPQAAANHGAPTAAKCDAHCPVCPTADTWKLLATPPSSPGVRVNLRDCSRSRMWAVPAGNSSPSPRLRPRADSLLTLTGSSPVLPPAPGWLAWGRQKRKRTSIKRKKNWKSIQQQLGDSGSEPASISGLLCPDTSLPGLWPLVFRPPSQLLVAFPEQL